jgi:outer membrane protein assembly factor BamB
MMKPVLCQVVGIVLLAGACSKSTPAEPTPPVGRDSGGTAADAAPPSALPGAARGKGVLMHGLNLQRTGANLEETFLTPALVGSASFGKLYCQPVDDELYAQLLYVSGVDVAGKGKHDVIYAMTVNDSVYAFDALAEGPALWEQHYTDTAKGITAQPTADLTRVACGGNYKDMSHLSGIIGTPAIDADSKTMYFVVRTKENGVTFQRLHAVDLGSGSERPGSPVEIQASIAGTGAGNVGGMVPFDPLRNNQRPALTLHDGLVYIGWSSHCDEGPYHGWVIGYDAKTLAQAVVWNASPNGTQAGIWMSGQGFAIDDQGSMYLITGNGTADLQGGPNRGESFVKLRREGGTLTILDWFTPYNYQFLESTDRDLGSSGAVLIPGAVIGGGKEGKLYVLDRNSFGNFNAAGDTQITQSIAITGLTRSHIHGSPAYWKSAAGEYVYLMAEEDYLKQMTYAGGKLQLRSMSGLKSPFDPIGPKPGGYTMPGGVLALSADGDKTATGVLWSSIPINRDSNQAVVPGILRAFDASDVSKDELWNSERDHARDSFGNFAKFNPPTVYNGRVYVPTFSNQYCVYSKLP